MHLIHTGCSPPYMSELVTSTSSHLVSGSVLRAVDDMNNLRLVSCWASGALRSPALQRGTHFPHHSMKLLHKAFKRELKTVLFKRAYSA